MKAAVVFANGDIRHVDWDEPAVNAGEIKVAVKACGICGSDVPRVWDNGAHYYPIILGHEFSGEVVEIGEGVTKFAVGDRVAGIPLIPCMKCEDCVNGNYSLCKNYKFIGSSVQGAFADYVVVPEDNAIKLPDNISFEEGALFEPSSVACHGLKCANFRAGKSAAILGCGTIGILTLQWAKLSGAKSVTAFLRSTERDFESDPRVRFVRDMGADFVINTLDEGFIDQAKKLTSGRGFDYVFETSGSEATMMMSTEIAANKATVCYIGTPKADLTFTPRHWENLNRKELNLTGSWMSYSAPFPGDEWELTKRFFESGELKYDDRFFYGKYPMSSIKGAFEEFLTPGKVKGRILMVNE